MQAFFLAKKKLVGFFSGTTDFGQKSYGFLTPAILS